MVSVPYGVISDIVLRGQLFSYFYISSYFMDFCCFTLVFNLEITTFLNKMGRTRASSKSNSTKHTISSKAKTKNSKLINSGTHLVLTENKRIEKTSNSAFEESDAQLQESYRQKRISNRKCKNVVVLPLNMVQSEIVGIEASENVNELSNANILDMSVELSTGISLNFANADSVDDNTEMQTGTSYENPQSYVVEANDVMDYLFEMKSKDAKVDISMPLKKLVLAGETYIAITEQGLRGVIEQTSQLYVDEKHKKICPDLAICGMIGDAVDHHGRSHPECHPSKNCKRQAPCKMCHYRNATTICLKCSIIDGVTVYLCSKAKRKECLDEHIQSFHATVDLENSSID